MDIQPKTGYVMADGELEITDCCEVVGEWFGWYTADLLGQPLTDMIPELIGREEEMVAMSRQSHHPPLCVPQTQRLLVNGRERYFDVQASYLSVPSPTWLVTLTDVTQAAEQTQRLHQRRNELHLLSNQLTTANEQLTFLLKRFVPAPIAEQLIQARQLPALGGHQRTVATIVFADMRNFTGIAEKQEPEAMFDILNTYLNLLAEAVWEHEGTIIQIVGDLLMATFNVPHPQPDHVWRGVQAAVAMQQKLASYEAIQDPQLPPVQFGVGVHTGPVVTGYLGVRDRYRYSVVSDTTNVAFHLCSRARGGQVIISQPVFEAVGEQFATTYLADVHLKARQQALPIYEVAVEGEGEVRSEK